MPKTLTAALLITCVMLALRFDLTELLLAILSLHIIHTNLKEKP